MKAWLAYLHFSLSLKHNTRLKFDEIFFPNNKHVFNF